MRSGNRIAITDRSESGGDSAAQEPTPTWRSCITSDTIRLIAGGLFEMTGTEPDSPGLARPELVRVLESAARLQEVLPDAVLVGGSAAALWANHRFSHDHDHVLQDLSD